MFDQSAEIVNYRANTDVVQNPDYETNHHT